jgi:hypothetical protein
LDYFASGGVVGCPALLVEPSGSNSCLQSENFLITWSPSNISVSTGTTAAFTAPDGTTSADLLTASASGSARIVQSFSFVSGTTYTYSAFAKAGSGFFGLTLENGGVASGAAVIWNLNTGALAVSGVVGAGYTLQSQGIENYGNGWYRCRMTVLLGRTVAGNMRANTSDGTMSTAIIQSASGNTAYVWGAQLETGSVATSYIPTTTGSVTRNADVVTLSGAVSGCIGQTEGTIYAEFEYRTDTSTRRILAISDGSQLNRVFLYFAGGSVIASIQAGTMTVGTPVVGFNKVAFGYIQNGVSGTLTASLNGAAVVSGTTAAYPASLNTINVGKIEDTATTSQINARIRSAALYTSRLTTAELIALSTL